MSKLLSKPSVEENWQCLTIWDCTAQNVRLFLFDSWRNDCSTYLLPWSTFLQNPFSCHRSHGIPCLRRASESSRPQNWMEKKSVFWSLSHSQASSKSNQKILLILTVGTIRGNISIGSLLATQWQLFRICFARLLAPKTFICMMLLSNQLASEFSIKLMSH